MAWREVQPEPVSGRDVVSFVVAVEGQELLRAWQGAKEHLPEPVVRIGLGKILHDKSPRPEWWQDAWLTRESAPYAGEPVEQVIATASASSHPYDFDAPGDPVWVVRDQRWVRAGTFDGLTDHPGWLGTWIEALYKPDRPPLTTPDPSTLDPVLTHIRRVWIRVDDPLGLWASGIHAVMSHLHSFSSSEDQHAVRLSARCGVTPEHRRAEERARAEGKDFKIPMIGKTWAIRVEMTQPLGDRYVLVEVQ